MQTAKWQAKEGPSEKEKYKTEDKLEDTENKVATQDDRRTNKERTGKRETDKGRKWKVKQETENKSWRRRLLSAHTPH